MATLKIGSKGKEVETAQKLLNKVGAKLVVDGDFGKGTQKATIKFQHKCELVKDGKIGPFTMAALKYGKALPTFPSDFLASISGNMKQIRGENMNKAQASKDVTKRIAVMEADWAKFSAEITKLEDEMQGEWAMSETALSQLAINKKTFDSVLLSNPAKAEKLAQQSKALVQEYSNVIQPNLIKQVKHATMLRNTAKAKLESNFKAVKAAVATMDKI
ncbi:MAG: peptidoglycan-binding protein [Sedimentitalea sp.]